MVSVPFDMFLHFLSTSFLFSFVCLFKNFFLFFDREVGFIGGHEQGGDTVKAVMNAGPTICPGATIRHVFDPTPIRDEPLFCYPVFKFICIQLSKSLLLGDMDLLAARELKLGPAEGLNHMLLALQLGADGHYDLASVDPGHCALGLSKGTMNTYLEPRFGQHASHEWPLERAVSKVP